MPLAFSRMMTMDALNPLQFVSALTQQTLKHHSKLNLLFTFRKFEVTNLYYFHWLIYSYFTLYIIVHIVSYYLSFLNTETSNFQIRHTNSNLFLLNCL